MPDPATTAVAAAAASATAISIALFGVDHYSLLYALVGAFFALQHGDQMGRARAVVYVLLSTLGGAVFGNVVVDHYQLKARIVLIGLCLVGGIVAQALAAVLLQAAPLIAKSAIGRFFGGDKA